MKAFLASLVVMTVVGFAAYGVLHSLDYSAQDVFQSHHTGRQE